MRITNVRPWGGDLSDVEVADGRIAAIDPAAAGTPAGQGDVDGGGRILLPSFSDVHVHLDSTRIGLPFREHTGSPGVWPMVMNDRAHWREDPPVADRATETLGRMIAGGVTTVRTYAQVDTDCRLERLEGVLAAKEAHRDRCDVGVIAFPQAGLLREEGSPEVLEEALCHGADAVGGIDPCALDRDPVRHLDIVFGLAEKYQVPVDFHLHEPGELGVFSADLICERTRALGMQGRVTLSHAYDLGGVDEATSRRLVEQFAELDVAMATVAPSARRQLPLVDLVEAGVRIGVGEDGQRDFWSPYGDCDMLARTWQLAFTHGFRRDDLVELCVALATVGGRSVIDAGGPRVDAVAARPGLAVGDPADLVLVVGDSVTAAVMDRAGGRTVLRQGVVVAENGTLA